MTLQRDNIVRTETIKRDKMMIIFAWISWKICFKMCKLWFLQHCYNISKQDFFKSAQWGTKLYKPKNITMFLCTLQDQLCSKCHESDMTPLSAQSNPAVAAWRSITPKPKIISIPPIWIMGYLRHASDLCENDLGAHN